MFKTFYICGRKPSTEEGMAKTIRIHVQSIEEFGIVLEHAGFPRMAGKIFGCLLTANVPDVSVDELTEKLKASRGSISTMTRILIQYGLIDRIGKPGQRKDYFRIRSDVWSQVLKARMTQIVELHRVVEHTLQTVSAKETLPYNRLKEMHDLYEFFQGEFQKLLDRWEEHKNNTVRHVKAMKETKASGLL